MKIRHLGHLVYLFMGVALVVIVGYVLVMPDPNAPQNLKPADRVVFDKFVENLNSLGDRDYVVVRLFDSDIVGIYKFVGRDGADVCIFGPHNARREAGRRQWYINRIDTEHREILFRPEYVTFVRQTDPEWKATHEEAEKAFSTLPEPAKP